ncbi:hypothetical protein SCEN_K02640 [Saccharomyces cerevisiae]|uniref:Uncharacterized protein n=1 Tax=Saccharomyces cerevisiae (strain AWRI1631) TaxID=545124 RepID=B5VMH7_YEAS6|nr:hypothetical protein AWRI1631_112510 [Saccharomyces cerevisiae AWRI1631]QHB10028.1 hypothetical protein SCEN_K02640 [Saccharomyces cerevisiae]
MEKTMNFLVTGMILGTWIYIITSIITRMKKMKKITQSIVMWIIKITIITSRLTTMIMIVMMVNPKVPNQSLPIKYLNIGMAIVSIMRTMMKTGVTNGHRVLHCSLQTIFLVGHNLQILNCKTRIFFTISLTLKVLAMTMTIWILMMMASHMPDLVIHCILPRKHHQDRRLFFSILYPHWIIMAKTKKWH